MKHDAIPKIEDYDLNHPDLKAAKKLEEHYILFEIFNIQDPRVITLVLAGARTIANNFGTFSYLELDNLLGYMSKNNRSKVINYLKKFNWIVFNGIDFEMPGYVRSLLVFLFSSLIRGDLSISEQIRVVSKEAELSEYYNFGDDREKEDLFYLTLKGSLIYWRDYMQRTLQKRSRRELLKIIRESGEIIQTVRELQKGLRKKKDGLFSNLSKQQEVHELISKIIEYISEILHLEIEGIRENAKAIGEYIRPEMLEDFLRNSAMDRLSDLAIKNFASPKQVLQFREETVVTKTEAFVHNQPEVQEVTPPPPLVDFIEEEMITERAVNPLELLYHEIIVTMGETQRAPSEEILFNTDDNFGMAMYRTCQMIRLATELPSDEKKEEKLNLEINDRFKQLRSGPVAEMSESYITKVVSKKNDKRTW